MELAATFKHRPTIVHAIQYTRANVPALKGWLAGLGATYEFYADDSHLVIETIEGDRDCSVEEGYWIVEGIRHEVYPVRDDIFRAAYEDVDLENAELRLGGRNPGIYVDGKPVDL